MRFQSKYFTSHVFPPPIDSFYKLSVDFACKYFELKFRNFAAEEWGPIIEGILQKVTFAGRTCHLPNKIRHHNNSVI